MRSFSFSIPWRWRRAALAASLAALGGLAQAAVGLSTIAATDTDGPVTLYYPTHAPAAAIQRGPFTLELAEQGEPVRGNGHLVVISHGSGGGPWVHADLARTLVEAGFIVAMPQHHADNSKDGSNPGPNSWAIRPQEVSRAIDAVGRDARFAPLLTLDHVGVYGMSAGGHTALSMAGGHWSAAGFKRHCEANLVDDFQACVGLITRLTGGMLDGIKKWVALAVIRHRFDDETMLSHEDPRVAAVVAGVPAAADFDMASLAKPRVPLGLVTSQQDRWLVPRFHSDRVLQVCTNCEHIADLSKGGHGALLSPPPPGLTGLVGDMLNDPPGFERGQMHAVDQKITAFFVRHLSD
ncbi:MAG: dienelactone hydrolase [Rhodoferax sp.]|nr:dienelactone hydrolase [Rhodoferax sp.]MDP3653994.1 dienelactone hydrolase [Rhodoferax sp.]